MLATAEAMMACARASAEERLSWEAVGTPEPGTDSCENRSAAADPQEQAVQRRITQRTWGRLRQLHVEVDSRRVLVRGSSPTYYLKQLALAAVQEVLPTMLVELDIWVAQSEPARLPARAL